MRPINIYALTRISDQGHLQKLERQMSGRAVRLNIKNWEIQCLKKFVAKLCLEGEGGEDLEWFYSFQIPKLGKEFDLLRISDDMVVNVELKSDPVPDEQIKRQLQLNRYYLATLGRTIHSYTYISGTGRLVRLTNNENLVEGDWELLWEDLRKQGSGYKDHIEKLFREEDYLISPLTDPDRFLRQDYFLTSQQKDIRRHILESVQKNEFASGENSSYEYRLFHGFTGIPGTGKTLLLYSIALELSERDRVCVLHYGSYPQELMKLNERLKRIDFYPMKKETKLPEFDEYAAILVDEGHRMPVKDLEILKQKAEELKVATIFSYDREDFISDEEIGEDVVSHIRALPDYDEYRLTNRIRTNSELASFIRRVMQFTAGYHRNSFPSVAVNYANDWKEAELLIGNFRNEGYIYIVDEALNEAEVSEGDISTAMATCREFDKVAMVIDDSFYYDEIGYLRSEKTDGEILPVYNLFHGMSRAKYGLGLIIIKNVSVFDRLLGILQPLD